MKNLSKNPFLTIGVSADAEMQEIRQVAQRIIMEHRLEGGANSPAARRIETALEQLQDPVERYHWGLYWPELTKEEAEQFRSDPVLSTLAENPLQDGAAAYQRIAAEVPPDIRSHNIGVLCLLQAIAATGAAQKETPDDTSDDLACAAIWKRAFAHLLPIVRAEAFWMRKKLFARDLGDKRLNEARISNLRETYIPELLAPIGSVISDALLHGHAAVASTYVNLIRTSGFDAGMVEEMLSKVYKPLADRVERSVAQLKERLEARKEDQGEVGERELAHLLEQFEHSALKDLEVMLRVGNLPGYAEEHARDTSAEFLRMLSITAWNKGNHVKIAQKAIFLASRVADSASIRSKIEEDRSTIDRLTKEQETNARLAPQLAELKRLLDAKKWKEALPVIHILRAMTTGEQSEQMGQLHVTISNNAAAELMKAAMEEAKRYQYARAHQLLAEAKKLAYDFQLTLMINAGLEKIPKSAPAAPPKESTSNPQIVVYIAIGAIVLLFQLCSK